MGIVLAIVAAVVVLAGVAAYFLRRNPGFTGRFTAKEPSQRRLRLKYGREYDRLYAAHGDHTAVRQELTRRESERESLPITSLDGPEPEPVQSEAGLIR